MFYACRRACTSVNLVRENVAHEQASQKLMRFIILFENAVSSQRFSCLRCVLVKIHSFCALRIMASKRIYGKTQQFVERKILILLTTARVVPDPVAGFRV